MTDRILPDTGFFAYLLAPWQEQRQLSLLKALAEIQSGTGYVPIADIHRQLLRLGIPKEEKEIAASLDDFCQRIRTVIQHHHGRYRLTVGMLARHVQWQNRPGGDLVLHS